MMTQVYAHESRPGNRVGLHYSRFQRKPAVHFNINQLLGPTKKSQNPLFHRRIREDGIAKAAHAKDRGVKMERKPKLTDHQRRHAAAETLLEIARSYNGSGWTISSL